MPEIISSSELPSLAFGGAIATEDPAHMRLKVKANSPYDAFTTPSQIRLAASKHPSIRAAIDESLGAFPPPAPLAERAHLLGWSQWLATPPEYGGATDKDMQDLFLWNLEEMRCRNEQFAPKLLAAHGLFESSLEEAVATQRIGVKFLSRWRKNSRDLALYMDAPLSLRRDLATTYGSYSTVRFTPTFSQSIATHEFAHIAGTFRSQYLNEAAAECITDILCRDMNESVYMGHAILLKDLLTAANITTAEFSDIFAGTHGTLNESKLGWRTRQRTGVDVLARHTQDIRAIMQRIPRDLPSEEAFVVSAAGIMQQRKRYGTFEDIALRLVPSAGSIGAKAIAQEVRRILEH